MQHDKQAIAFVMSLLESLKDWLRQHHSIHVIFLENLDEMEVLQNPCTLFNPLLSVIKINQNVHHHKKL
jgi:hypothetical protein